MTYAQKLLDPRWQKKRLSILERDDFRCAQCNDDKESLQVHHKRYFRGFEPWEYENNYLEALCATCHFAVTFYKKEPFLIIKTNWVTKQTRVVLFYTYINSIPRTIVLKLNFSRKTVRELKSLPVNLKPLKA